MAMKILCCFTAILAAFCLLFTSCGKEEKVQYVSVYGYSNGTLSSDPVFMKSIFAGYGTVVERKSPETVADKKMEFGGSELTLVYKWSSVVMEIPMDFYYDASRNCHVGYHAESGKVQSVIDHEKWKGNDSSLQQNATVCTKEEALQIATEYAKEKWPIVINNEYTVSYEEYDGEKQVHFCRSFWGRPTNEVVRVLISPYGEIAGWGDYLKYPDGIPYHLQSAVENLDMELCKESVVHYIQDCAKDAPGIRITKFENENIWFEFSADGRVFLLADPTLEKDGEEYKTSTVFLIPLLQEGQNAAEDSGA